MSEEKLATLVRFFKALADASRLKILGLLATREHSVDELAAILDLTEPTVSHHLARLRELGLVRMTPAGNTHLYALEESALHALSKELLAPGAVERLVDDLDMDAAERKVLGTYFTPEGLLKEIPLTHKKRLIVLRRLIREFEFERRYTEKEVSAILKRFHEDYATLRREFIMNQLMDRADGLYWRLPMPEEN